MFLPSLSKTPGDWCPGSSSSHGMSISSHFFYRTRRGSSSIDQTLYSNCMYFVIVSYNFLYFGSRFTRQICDMGISTTLSTLFWNMFSLIEWRDNNNGRQQIIIGKWHKSPLITPLRRVRTGEDGHSQSHSRFDNRVSLGFHVTEFILSLNKKKMD